jgi:hypothetical protein
MTNTFKLISAAALLAVTSTAAFAQEVPLNTTVSGGAGAEIQVGQGEGAALVVTPAAAGVIAAAVILAAAAGSSSSTTTTNP